MNYDYKQVLFSIFILFSTAGFSQPELTSSNLANTGDSYTIYTNTSLPASSDPGSSGSNVTWDFSAIQQGNSSSLTYASTSNQDYPNANIKFDTQGSSNYFDVSNDAYTYYGFSASGATSNFTDGQDQARVPMSFNDSYLDAFSGTYDAFGQVFERTGELNVTYDGYGTLQTPQGTYSNVLRLEIIRTSTDEMNGQTLSNNLDTIYFWFNESTRHPIMTYTINYVDGSEQGRFLNYIDDADVVLSTNLNNITVNSFPNPARNEIMISSKENINVIEIYTINGRKVLNKQVNSSSFEVDVSSLRKGQYFYLLKNTKGTILSRKKLIVK